MGGGGRKQNEKGRKRERKRGLMFRVGEAQQLYQRSEREAFVRLLIAQAGVVIRVGKCRGIASQENEELGLFSSA